MRILKAVLFYFAVVFGAGLLLGPIRVLWLEPWLGPTVAVVCEVPLLLAAMMFAASHMPRWLGSNTGLLAVIVVGFGALLLIVTADFAVGLALRSKTWADQIAYLTTPAGNLYIGLLALFALMPVLMQARRARSSN